MRISWRGVDGVDSVHWSAIHCVNSACPFGGVNLVDGPPRPCTIAGCALSQMVRSRQRAGRPAGMKRGDARKRGQG